MSYTPRGMVDRWMLDTMKAVGIGKTLAIMCECRGRMVPVFKPACGPKDSEMEKKTWEWHGIEMVECRSNPLSARVELRCVVDCYPVIVVHGWNREECYANAVKGGCVEVVKPVPCPMCGSCAYGVHNFPTPVFVWCTECGIRGQEKEAVKEAVSAWNDMAAMIARGRKPRTADK